MLNGSARRRTPVLLLFVLGIFCGGGAAFAKSYSHPSVEQVVRLSPDGGLDVIDTRSYLFDGEFHNAFLTVDPAVGGSVQFYGVETTEGEPVREVSAEGTTLRWQYDARDQTRTFRVTYHLTGEVTRAADAALIDRQFLEPKHAPVDHYRLQFITPGPATLLKAFIFTPTGNVGTLNVSPERGQVEVLLGEVMAGFVRSRLIFDAGQVPDVASTGRPAYAEWLGDTATETATFRRDSANHLAARGGQARKPLPTWIAGLLAFVATLFCAWALSTWRRNGVEPQVAEVGPYFREPPEEIPPAVVPFVMSQQSPGTTAGPAALGATILDFARRGILAFEEREKGKILGFGGGREIDFVVKARPKEPLKSFEAEVYDMLAAAAAVDDRVTPKELKAFFTKHTTWAQTWVQLPRAWYESERGALLASNSGGYMFLFILLGVVLMTGMLVVSISSGNPVVVVVGLLSGVTTGLFGIICGAAMPRWKPETLLRARQWKAYGRFLADFSAMEEAPASHYKLWDYHFVYATALGVSKQYLANIKKQMTLHPEYFSTTPYWIMTSGNRSAYDAGDSLANLGTMQGNLEAVAQNLSALNSALSTATSSGGGFSGGSSGGSSGGGGASGAS